METRHIGFSPCRSLSWIAISLKMEKRVVQPNNFTRSGRFRQRDIGDILSKELLETNSFKINRMFVISRVEWSIDWRWIWSNIYVYVLWKQACNFFSFSEEDYTYNNRWTHRDLNVVVADNRLCTLGNERRRVFKEKLIARKTKPYRRLIFQWSPRGNSCLPTSREKQRCDALIRKATRRKGLPGLDPRVQRERNAAQSRLVRARTRRGPRKYPRINRGRRSLLFTSRRLSFVRWKATREGA